MILCRFADQTAVQLPSERRQIGMLFCRTAVVEIIYTVFGDVISLLLMAGCDMFINKQL